MFRAMKIEDNSGKTSKQLIWKLLLHRNFPSSFSSASSPSEVTACWIRMTTWKSQIIDEIGI